MRRTVLLNKVFIRNTIKRVKKEIKDKFKKDKPVFLVVLGGAMYFAANVIPENIPCEIDYIRLASYEGTERKELKLIYEPILDLQDRTVIIIEDIVDSGTTIEYLHNYLTSKNVKSVSIASLLYKESSKHLVNFKGHQIRENDFVIGYGLDYKGLYRNYSNISKVN